MERAADPTADHVDMRHHEDEPGGATFGLPGRLTLVRAGREESIAVPDHATLMAARTELELLRRFGTATGEAVMAALAARRDALRAASDRGDDQRIRDVEDMHAILEDARHPANREARRMIDQAFPELKQELNMDAINDESSRFRQDLADEVQASGAPGAEKLGDALRHTVDATRSCDGEIDDLEDVLAEATQAMREAEADGDDIHENGTGPSEAELDALDAAWADPGGDQTPREPRRADPAVRRREPEDIDVFARRDDADDPHGATPAPTDSGPTDASSAQPGGEGASIAMILHDTRGDLEVMGDVFGVMADEIEALTRAIHESVGEDGDAVAPTDIPSAEQLARWMESVGDAGGAASLHGELLHVREALDTALNLVQNLTRRVERAEGLTALHRPEERPAESRHAARDARRQDP